MSLTLREKYTLRVFKNSLLRKTFQPKNCDTAGEWRRLHSEELYNLHSSPNIIHVIIMQNEMGGECSRYGEEERGIQGFGGET